MNELTARILDYPRHRTEQSELEIVHAHRSPATPFSIPNKLVAFTGLDVMVRREASLQHSIAIGALSRMLCNIIQENNFYCKKVHYASFIL